MVSSYGAQWIFAWLGPLFLLAGAWRCIRAGSSLPQGRAWLLIGAIFSGVALYLWWSQASAG